MERRAKAGRLISGTAAIIAMLLPACCWAVVYYVSPAGDDASSGSSTHPFRTLQRAADSVNPGDTVIVRDGTYSGTGWTTVNLTRSGTASAWITFKAEHKGQAIVDGRGNAVSYGWSWEGGAGYIQIRDFEVRNASKIGFYIQGNNIVIAGNSIHSIGRVCTDTSDGLAGIYVTRSGSITIEKNVIHDIGRFAPGESGCSPTTNFYQNHDHGIYLDGVSNVTIKNNLFYNHRSGWGIQVYSGEGILSTGLTFLNNTFAFPNPYREGQVLIAAPGVADGLIENNLFYQPTAGGVRVSTTSGATTFSNVVITHNLTFGGAANSGTAPGVLISANLDDTDPKPVDPARFDFHLLSGSPAIDRGAETVQVTEDFDGTPRPQDGGWDIGAFEAMTKTRPTAPKNLQVLP